VKKKHRSFVHQPSKGSKSMSTPTDDSIVDDEDSNLPQLPQMRKRKHALLPPKGSIPSEVASPPKKSRTRR
jgi:hypothetical protein